MDLERSAQRRVRASGAAAAAPGKWARSHGRAFAALLVLGTACAFSAAPAAAAVRANDPAPVPELGQPLTNPTVPDLPSLFARQWALDNVGQRPGNNSRAGTPGADINVIPVWAQGDTGAGVIVADIDSGIYLTPGTGIKIVGGHNFAGANPTPEDMYGHGTYTASLIAAPGGSQSSTIGVAPGASIMPIEVLDASGSGSDATVTAGLAYAGAQGVRIANASFGSAGYLIPAEGTTMAAYPNTLYVVAAGNNGRSDIVSPVSPCAFAATLANVICVGASNQDDQPASFSNYGAAVSLFAPGENILGDWALGGTALISFCANGTSAAAPEVTGAAALMLAANPALSAAQIKADLLASVTRVPALTRLSASGGVLNVAAAVKAARASAASQATTTFPVRVSQLRLGGTPGHRLVSFSASAPGTVYMVVSKRQRSHWHSLAIRSIHMSAGANVVAWPQLPVKTRLRVALFAPPTRR